MCSRCSVDNWRGGMLGALDNLFSSDTPITRSRGLNSCWRKDSTVFFFHPQQAALEQSERWLRTHLNLRVALLGE